MGALVLTGDTSGSVTVNVPTVAGTNTATFPAATGTVMVSGNMPAFSAYQSTLQSVSNGVATKIQFQTKDFDTNNNYDNATNYRFTPTVAGYYQINATVQFSTTAFSSVASIYKNGSQYAVGSVGSFASGAINTSSCVSSVIYCNGSTDYIEIYGLQTSGLAQNTSASNATRFNACLVRGA